MTLQFLTLGNNTYLNTCSRAKLKIHIAVTSFKWEVQLIIIICEYYYYEKYSLF